MNKRVYKFEEGNAGMRALLGGKGANLAEMTNLGMPVPPGFTISTEACTDYYNDGKDINEDTKKQIFDALAWLEGVRGKKFGDENDPLLVSVRSGAPVSMPGMMDTILNLGLNDVSVVGFAKKTGNPSPRPSSMPSSRRKRRATAMSMTPSCRQRIFRTSSRATRSSTRSSRARTSRRIRRFS